MHRRSLLAWILSIAAAAPIAWAQPASNGSRADPQDAYATVPRSIYRSSLADYRGFSDEKLRAWKETNDSVGRIGGWRAYAKEAQETGPAGNPPPLATDKPAPVDGAKPLQGRPGGHKMN